MFVRFAVAIVAFALSAVATAQVKIGLMVSATGPTTAIGQPQRNTGELLPPRIGDTTIDYISLEDGGDTTRAVQNVKKLIQEHNVDAIIGPSTTPNALAILDAIAESGTPLMATVGTSSVVDPLDAKRRWVFKTTQNDDLIAAALVKHMKKAGVKTFGFIGFKDPYGENWNRVFVPMAQKAGIERVATEYYQRADLSVTGQALKLIAAKPDAVLVAGVGGPGVLPQTTLRDLGYKGAIYQTHGVATDDFIRLGKEKVEGTVLARSDAGDRRDRRREPDQACFAALHPRVRKAVRTEAGNVRRQYLRRRADPAGGDACSAGEGETRNAGIPPGTARFRREQRQGPCRLPGCVQHERNQPQRDGRARAGAGHGQGRQVPAGSGVNVGAPLACACPA